MKILGVDPGLNITGYGMIDASSPGDVRLVEAGVIRTPSGQNIDARLKRIYLSLERLLYERAPKVLVLEKIYAHYRHPVTSILMGHARGITCLLCGLKRVRLINYPSTRIKKAIAGTGHASKKQIQGMVCDALNLKTFPKPVDVTDALALALGYVHIELTPHARAGHRHKGGPLRISVCKGH